MIDNSQITMFFNEEEHRYADQFNNVYTPATTFIGRYVPAFQSDYWAKVKADERKVSTTVIKAEWKSITDHACAKGTEKHGNIEEGIKQSSKFKDAIKLPKRYASNEMFTLQRLLENEGMGKVDLSVFYDSIGKRYPLIYKTIAHFVNQGYEVYAEVGVFSFQHLISGMIDCLLVKGKEFIILDWKTNKNEIKFSSGYYKKDKRTGEFTDEWVSKSEFMLYPIDTMSECTGNHYSLQLSLYAYLVELYGFKCVGLFLAHIRDQYELNQWGMPKKDPITKLYIPILDAPESVQWHPIKYYKNTVETLINYHYENSGIESKRLTQTTLYA